MASNRSRESSSERNRLMREINQQARKDYPTSITPLGQVNHIQARHVGDRVTSKINAILARRADIHTH